LRDQQVGEQADLTVGDGGYRHHLDEVSHLRQSEELLGDLCWSRLVGLGDDADDGRLRRLFAELGGDPAVARSHLFVRRHAEAHHVDVTPDTAHKVT